MTQEEFIEKMRELDPFFHESEIPLEILYEHYETIVEEMERLEDIEDNTIQLKAHIDYLNEKLQEERDANNKPKKKRVN